MMEMAISLPDQSDAEAAERVRPFHSAGAIQERESGGGDPPRRQAGLHLRLSRRFPRYDHDGEQSDSDQDERRRLRYGRDRRVPNYIERGIGLLTAIFCNPVLSAIERSDQQTCGALVVISPDVLARVRERLRADHHPVGDSACQRDARNTGLRDKRTTGTKGVGREIERRSDPGSRHISVVRENSRHERSCATILKDREVELSDVEIAGARNCELAGLRDGLPLGGSAKLVGFVSLKNGT